MIRIATLFILVVMQHGCVWHVTPPAAPEEPQVVFISEYGRHTRVALPAEGRESLIEYGFGDWRFYALEERGIVSGLRALFFSNASALSRRQLPWTTQAEAFQQIAGTVRSERILVERQRVDSLRERLELRWHALDTEMVVRDWENLTLAKVDDPYHLFHNSNHQTAAWLRELGVSVDGITIWSRFSVRQSENEGEE